MPLYDYSCSTHGKFEAYRRVGVTATPCPLCSEESPREFVPTLFTHSRAYDQSIDGEFPNAGKPKILNREGGGKASQTSTGGYRPMITHKTICPSEKRWRNVAVLGEFPYGQRLNCEACGWVWIYSATSTDVPLVPEVDESLRPGRTIHMNPDVPLHSGYVEPDRGA